MHVADIFALNLFVDIISIYYFMHTPLVWTGAYCENLKEQGLTERIDTYVVECYFIILTLFATFQ